jgi:hypothetical protein
MDFGSILGSIGGAVSGYMQQSAQAELASQQAWYQYNVAVQQADYQNALYKQQNELYLQEQAYAKSVSAWNVQAIIDQTAVESNLIRTQATIAQQNAMNIEKSAKINLSYGLRQRDEATGTTRQAYAASGFAVGTGSAKATEQMTSDKATTNIKQQYNQTMSAAENYRSKASSSFLAADLRQEAGAQQVTNTLLTDNFRIRT